MFATAQSPYYQPVGGLQHAKNQVNTSTTTITQNQYKRDRSSSNNARRPPIPGVQQPTGMTNSSLQGTLESQL